MILISQGLGKPPHNCIVQPWPGGSVGIGDVVRCTDPRSGKTVEAECIDHWTLMWVELTDSFCQETYGADSYTIYKLLKQKPEFRNAEYVRFCKLKPID
jgi:hypothetical protein